MSGDTIVIRGEPRGGPPPERTLSFSGVSAPRLERRANRDGEDNPKDEVGSKPPSSLLPSLPPPLPTHP